MVSIMGKGCIVARILPLRCFLFFTNQLMNYTNTIPIKWVLFAPFTEDPEVFLPTYSQTAILHAVHFRSVVNDKNKFGNRELDPTDHMVSDVPPTPLLIFVNSCQKKKKKNGKKEGNLAILHLQTYVCLGPPTGIGS